MTVAVFTESAPVMTRSGSESGEGVMASSKEEKESPHAQINNLG